MLSKKPVSLHVAWGKGGYTNNLILGPFDLIRDSDTSVRVPHLSLDLSVNLRSRSKQANAYLDAMELIDGAIHELTTIEIHDEYAVGQLAKAFAARGLAPGRVKCSILLNVVHELYGTLQFVDEEHADIVFGKEA